MKSSDIFQIASIGTFFVIFALRALHLRLVRRINPIAVGRGKKGFALVFELVAFAGLVVWMIAVVLTASHAGFVDVNRLNLQLFESDIARAAGIAVVALSMVVFALAFLSFGNSWRVGLDRQTPGALVTTGIFAVSRNPIYVAMDLWFIGIALMNGTLFFVVFAVLAAAALHWQMLREERFCAELYGEPYVDYRARIARYFIW